MLLIAIVLIFANGFFVAAEFALVKVRATQLDRAHEDGSSLAGVARGLLDHLDAYLSATQLGITLTSLGLGWIGEPAVAKLLEPLFHALELSEDTSHKISIAVGFSIISFLHIVLGEVAPKSLAIARPVGVSIAVAWPMRLFYYVFYPALVVLNATSNALLRAVGVEPAGTHSLVVDPDELVRIAADSAAGGQISANEGVMVENVFAFSTRVAREIMVPRNRVHAVDLSEPLAEQLSALIQLGHSRYPVHRGELDEPLGVLHIKDLLGGDASEVDADRLVALCRPALFVPETLPAEALMRQMQKKRTHLAVVVDEHGGVAGVVSLEDALEELVGDIQDEYDSEPEILEPIDNGYSVAGEIQLKQLAEVLDIGPISSSADTLQGWTMEQLGRLPRRGDEIALDGWTLRITKMDQRTRVLTRAEVLRQQA